MTFWFLLPKTFDPLEFLTIPRLQMYADDARWFISTIVRKTVCRDTDPYGCVRLNMEILKRLMYQGTCREIIDALERGAVETTPPFPGVKSTGYRLAHRFLSDTHVRKPAVDPRLIHRIDRERARNSCEQKRRRKPIHDSLDAEQRHVSITPNADHVLQQLPHHTRLCQDVLIGNIRRREYPFSVSSTGRVFNCITGLKRELRPEIRIGSRP